VGVRSGLLSHRCRDSGNDLRIEERHKAQGVLFISLLENYLFVIVVESVLTAYRLLLTAYSFRDSGIERLKAFVLGPFT